MGLKVTNNAFGTLNASINSSATTIVLVAGQGARFPTLSAGDYFYATLIDTSNNLEIVKCTARSTDTLTVVRAQDSTTARAYATNDRFELRPTAALFNEKANSADVAATYVELAGDTMTGALTLQTAGFSGGVISTATTGDTSSRWRISRNTSTGLSAKDWFVSCNTSDGAFAIHEGSVADALIITPSGRVRIPGQPAASASYSGGDISATNIVPLNGNLDNRGGLTIASNRFTVPTTGYYVIGYHHLATTTGTQLQTRKNGTGIAGGTTQAHPATAHGNFSVQNVESLAAGDYIEFFVTGGTLHGNASYNRMYIYLLG
jgi:hypothetical protein